MNSLQINNAIYKIQDLVVQKKLTTFKKFKNHFQNEYKTEQRSYKFLNDLFEKIFAFAETIQHYPESVVLVQALKPMFNMLLKEMIIPEYVYIFCEKTQYLNKVKYGEIRQKRLIQKKYNYFIISYKKRVPTLAALEKQEILKNNKIKKAIHFRQEEQKRAEELNAYILSIGKEAYEKETEKTYMKWKSKLIEEYGNLIIWE